jgi:hypothetical protein
MSKVEKFNWTVFGTFMLAIVSLVVYNISTLGITCTFCVR